MRDGFFENLGLYDKLIIIAVLCRRERLYIVLEAYDGADTPAERWILRCVPLDYEIRSSQVLFGSFLDNDPLLWSYVEPSATLSFTGSSGNSEAIIGRLFVAHHEEVPSRFGFGEHLNTANLAWFLDGGYGVLASGPLPIVAVYDRVLRDHGLSTSIMTQSPRASATTTRVLTLDDNYIVGQSFRARRLR